MNTILLHIDETDHGITHQNLIQKSYSSLNYKDDNFNYDKEEADTTATAAAGEEEEEVAATKQLENDEEDSMKNNLMSKFLHGGTTSSDNHLFYSNMHNNLHVYNSNESDFDYEMSQSNSNSSTRSNSMENGNQVVAYKQQQLQSSKEVKFDDTSSWLDEQQYHGQQQQSMTASKSNEQPQCVSKLITKLFPSIKDQQDKLKQEQVLREKEAAEKLKQMQAIQTATSTVSAETNANAGLLKQKLTQLEAEIDKFQKKNMELVKLKEKCELELKLAETNRKLFDKQKEEEFGKLKEMHDEEMRKLKLEKKIFEQYKLSAKDTLDRKERDELDRIRRQVLNLISCLR